MCGTTYLNERFNSFGGGGNTTASGHAFTPVGSYDNPQASGVSSLDCLSLIVESISPNTASLLSAVSLNERPV